MDNSLIGEVLARFNRAIEILKPYPAYSEFVNVIEASRIDILLHLYQLLSATSLDRKGAFATDTTDSFEKRFGNDVAVAEPALSALALSEEAKKQVRGRMAKLMSLERRKAEAVQMRIALRKANKIFEDTVELVESFRQSPGKTEKTEKPQKRNLRQN